jgi:hypothetical protein
VGEGVELACEAFCVASMMAFKVTASDVPMAFESVWVTPGMAQAKIPDNKTTTSKADRWL